MSLSEQAEARDPLMIAEGWMNEGRDLAIATVVETWGSAPRPTGSHLVIDAEGNFEGSVSGGCVEGAVIAEAIDVIESGKPRMLEFGVADETAARVGRRRWGDERGVASSEGDDEGEVREGAERDAREREGELRDVKI